MTTAPGLADPGACFSDAFPIRGRYGEFFLPVLSCFRCRSSCCFRFCCCCCCSSCCSPYRSACYRSAAGQARSPIRCGSCRPDFPAGQKIRQVFQACLHSFSVVCFFRPVDAVHPRRPPVPGDFFLAARLAAGFQVVLFGVSFFHGSYRFVREKNVSRTVIILQAGRTGRRRCGWSLRPLQPGRLPTVRRPGRRPAAGSRFRCAGPGGGRAAGRANRFPAPAP